MNYTKATWIKLGEIVEPAFWSLAKVNVPLFSEKFSNPLTKLQTLAYLTITPSQTSAFHVSLEI